MEVKNFMVSKQIGGIAYLVGIPLALLIGAVQATGLIDIAAMLGGLLSPILVAVGLVIGFLNIKAAESNEFLLAVIALGLGAGVLAGVPIAGPILQGAFGTLALVIVPAALVVAVLKIVKVANI